MDNAGQVKKRIVHVIHWPKSGIVTLVHNIIRHMDRSRYDLHVVFFEEDIDSVESFNALSVPVHHVPIAGKSPLKSFVTFRKIIKRLVPDIVHTHSFLPALLFRSMNKKIKHVSTVHNNYPYFHGQSVRSRIKRALTRYIHMSPDVSVVCVSSDVQAVFQRKIKPLSEVVVIENGVCIQEYFEKENLINSGQKKQNINEILSIGRLSHQKSFDLLLKAFRIVLNQKDSIRLTIVGDGPEKKQLKLLAKQLNMDPWVNFAGWNEHVFSVFTHQQLYVCTSIHEGFGLAIAEAMLYGLPVVAVKIPGITSLIKDGQTGFIVDSRSPSALAEKIISVMDAREMREKVRQNGQRHVIRNFDICKVVHKYEAIYFGDQRA